MNALMFHGMLKEMGNGRIGSKRSAALTTEYKISKTTYYTVVSLFFDRTNAHYGFPFYPLSNCPISNR